MLNNILNNPFFSNLAMGFLQGKFANHPLMKQAQKMLYGKNKQEQIQTLLNTAQTIGFDVNEKRFTAEDLKKIGINIP